jgi:hypothetical protein
MSDKTVVLVRRAFQADGTEMERSRSMTSGETRFVLLMVLAWRLRQLSVGSTVALPAHGEAVLSVQCIDGRLPVLAVQHKEEWVIVWSAESDGELPVVLLDVAARRIASLARHGSAA